MPYTARELITKAYYLSGIVARNLQSVSGQQITDGLAILNELLAEESITGSLIPYYKEYSFTAVAGQESYFVPGLIDAETLTFNIGPVRYSTQPTRRRRYFGTPRQDNIESLPYAWHFERKLNGADVYLYFLPNEAYPLKLWGKFKFDEITDLCADLLLIHDQFYLKYLSYAVARDICEEYLITMPTQSAMTLSSLEEKLTYVSPLDLSVSKKTSFQRDTSLNYGDANLGRGWRP